LIRYFRIAFHSVNESEAVNTRHEIFAALIVAGYVALICRPTGRLRVVINVSLLVTAALVVVSLSRAVILAGALPLLLAAARALLRTRVSIFAMVLTGAAVVAAPVLGPPLWALFNGRFVEDTGSYGARLQAIANISSGKFASRLLLGGGDFGLSTHTMVLDATLRGSLIAGLAALVVIAVFFRHTARAAAAFMNSGELAALAAFGAGALAIVRAFTGGGGLPHLVEWSAIGAMVAAEVARRSRSSAEANSAGFVLGRPQAAIADVPRRF
jgi:hypothetical protein